MLAATAATPKPGNWHGVSEGLERAKAALAAGQHQAAYSLINEVLEFAPMEARGWHFLGKTLQALGEHGRALECFRHAHALYASRHAEQNDSPASTTLAKLLWRQGEKEAARNMIDSLIDRQGESDELLSLKRAWEMGA